MRVTANVKADENSEPRVLPDEKLLTEMLEYDEEMVKAGVMLPADRLHQNSNGKRVRSSGEKRMVIDGPFVETRG